MDGGERRLSGAAALLILLAIASFATAAITITNITEWSIQAKPAPIKKEKGSDMITSNYINTGVTTETKDDFTNRTIITLTGFKGDPTNYTEVIRICNRDSRSYKVQLVYKGLLNGGTWPDKVKYVKLSLGGEPSGGYQIDQNTQIDTPIPSDPISIDPEQCLSVSAEILIHPDADDGVELIRLQIDVVSVTNPPPP
ncbi:MAG: hypothetical protein QXF90_06255 [Thermofilaceae archaeon]